MIYYKQIPRGQFSYIYYPSSNDTEVYLAEQNKWVPYKSWPDKIWYRDDITCIPEYQYEFNQKDLLIFIGKLLLQDTSSNYIIAYREHEVSLGIAKGTHLTLAEHDSKPDYLKHLHHIKQS